MATRKTIYKNKRDTVARWTAADPVIGAGVLAITTDVTPNPIKVGDGVKRWTELEYSTSSSSGGLDAAGVRAVVLTGLSTATNAAIAATDTILEAFGKLAARVAAIWDEEDIRTIVVPVGATGISFRSPKRTYTSIYIDSQDLTGAADAPTSFTIAVSKNGTNQFTTGAITTAAATYDHTDFDTDLGDLITVVASNTDGIAGSVAIGMRNKRRV